MGHRIRLRGVGPQLEGKFWESTQRLRVGRTDGFEVLLNDASISRRHAEVIASTQGWVVRDLGSTNGTFLNGVRVGSVERKLRHRDFLQCGNVVMILAVLDEEEVNDIPEEMEVELSTQNTWEKALEVAAYDKHDRPQAGDRLLTLLRTSQHLGHIGTLEDLLRHVLEDAVVALDAQRGAIVLVNEKTGELKLRSVSTGERETPTRSPFSRSLAQRSFSRAESLLCKNVKHSPELEVAMSIADGGMSSIICALLRSPRKPLGVLHLDRGPFQEPFTKDDLHLADAIAASVSAGIESAQLLERQRDLFIQTITTLAQAVEMRDEYTGGHTQRVTDYALLLSDAIELCSTDRRWIQLGTPLHDIGKIGIDDSILRKPGKLTPEEFEIMKTHTTKGAAILETIPDLEPIIPIARNHHERWDGKGYPDRLAGVNIPRMARIVAVADAFDAMTSNRPYRAGMPLDTALRHIQEGAGTQFDPALAEVFVNLRNKIGESLILRDPHLATVIPVSQPATLAIRQQATG